MVTLKDVVKNTLLSIQKNGQTATPEIYQKTFYEEAKKLNIAIDEPEWKNTWSKKLDPKIRQQMKNFPIKTQEDFIQFLNATINRLNQGSNKEQLLIYRDLLAIFIHHYATTNPDGKYHALIKETREYIMDGESSPHAQIIKEKWNTILKAQKEQPEEMEENLNFFSPLLRPSLNEKPRKQEAIIKAQQMLEQDVRHIIKEQLIEAIQKALKERIQIDKAILAGMLKKHTQEIEKVLEVVAAKISSVQIAGEMIFDELKANNKKLTDLSLEEQDLLSFKENMLTLLTSSQKRFEQIKDSVNKTKSGLDEIAIKVGGEKPERIDPPKHSLDTLTGVYTMEGAKEIIQHQEELFEEYQQSYSLFFVDIDNFKQINEKHGQASGDKILATFGKLLKNIVRENDYIVRFDGEEFLVILAGMDHFDSSYIAEKIRAQIEESTFVYGQHQMHITVTIGVSDRHENQDFDGVLQTSQNRMRIAKTKGYNQISTTDES